MRERPLSFFASLFALLAVSCGDEDAPSTATRVADPAAEPEPEAAATDGTTPDPDDSETEPETMPVDTSSPDGGPDAEPDVVDVPMLTPGDPTSMPMGDSGSSNGGMGDGDGSGGAAGSSGGSGGGAGVGIPQDTPTRLDPVLPPGSAWSFPTGDPLNATRPVLASITGGAVIAGSSEDPATVGVDAFEMDVVSEAFVARLDHDGNVLWSVPLYDAGLPRDIEVDSNGDIVVAAPYMPGFATVTNSSSYEDLYVAKLSGDGEIVFERQVSVDFGQDGSSVSGLTVDGEGSITLSGFAYDSSGQHPLFVKLASDGTEQWSKLIEHEGTQGWANDIVAMPNGDVVSTGYFDGTANFGGDTLASQGLSGEFSIPNGFVVRFAPNGDHVYSARFGGSSLDGGTGLAALADSTLLTGGITGDVDIGGASLAAPENGGSFLASLDPNGNASWATLASGTIGRALTTDPAGNVYLAGQLGGDRIVAAYDADGVLDVEATVGGGGSIDSYALAVDDAFGVWVAGTFSGQVDFGNDNVLDSGDAPGVFLVRLQRIVLE